MKKSKKNTTKEYLKTLRLVLFPPRKKYILFSTRKKINAGRFNFCEIKINDLENIKQKGKYFKAPTDLYRAVRALVTELDYIYFTKNQKGFNTYFFNKNFDVIISDRGGRIIGIEQNLGRNQISRHFENGYYVYFLPLGSITYYDLKKNDLINFRRKPSYFDSEKPF